MPLKGFCLYYALLGLMQTTTSVVVSDCRQSTHRECESTFYGYFVMVE